MKQLQKLGKALMLPVAVLPICGILMGLGYLLCPAYMMGSDVAGELGYATSGAAYSIGFFLIKAGGALIDNMAVLFAVGVAVGLQLLYQLYHVLDVIGGLAYRTGTGDVEMLLIAEERIGVEAGDVPDAFSGFLSPLADLVLAVVAVSGEVTDIGDVHDVVNLITSMFKCPVEQILEDICSQVSDVGIIIDCRSAAVHGDLSWFDRDKFLNAPGHRIVQSHATESSLA